MHCGVAGPTKDMIPALTEHKALGEEDCVPSLGYSHTMSPGPREGFILLQTFHNTGYIWIGPKAIRHTTLI